MIEICPQIDCTGCEACAAVCPKMCIRMEMTTNGFAYPKIDGALCVDCGICQKVCPATGVPFLREPLGCYAAYSYSDDVRYSTASGGVATELYRAFIEDGGVVVGVALINNEAKYLLAKDICELEQFKGSKYVESSTNGVYGSIKQELIDGKKVLFVGLPCHVSSVLSVIPGGLRDNLFTVDLICHGCPSSAFLKDHVKSKYGESSSVIGFRDNVFSQYYLQVRTSRGEVLRVPASCDLYFDAFSRGYSYRRSCYSCRYAKLERVGDITLGDFWGLGEKTPFSGKASSVSVVLQNSKKGEQLLKMAAERLVLVPREISEAIEKNEQLKRPSSFTPDARLFHENSSIVGPEKAAKHISGISVKVELFKWKLSVIKKRILKRK